jgi:cytochrome c553
MNRFHKALARPQAKGRRLPRTRLLAAMGLLAATHALAVQAAAIAGMDDVEAGRRIYQQGMLRNGQPLPATRLETAGSSGSQAACVQCHRPSGMGNVEGDIQAPPVTGNALFATGDKVIATMDPRSGKAFNRAHDPYSDATLARALRSGQRADGSLMSVLMPRYALGDADMRALTAYLHQLSSDWSPGVSADTIRFATVITPDVPAARRTVFLDMVRKIVAQKNGSTKVAGHGSRHHMTSAAELVLGTERRWVVDAWELKGAPQTWAAQLDDYYARGPVFALLSGLGGAEWGPVDAFCDRRAIPCWFPSIPLPPTSAPAYTIYFNGGVALEAGALASYLRQPGAHAPRRVVQVHRDDAVGRGAASALASALESSGISVQDRPLNGTGAEAVGAALHDLDRDDAVMFWLAPADVAQLANLPPVRASTYFSGVLGGADDIQLPAAWKEAARIVYPYELPELRAANLAYFKAWMNQRHVPMVDEIMQSEVYFSFAFLTDTVSEMLDNLHRDYLIERAENMISRREGSKAEAEYYSSTQAHVRTHSQADGVIAARPESTEAPGLRAQRLAGSAFGKREGTSAYPHLTLGPGQRFASKGAYIVRFGADGALRADGNWIVP